MPPSTPLRVFISYAHKDGSEVAQRLSTDLATKFYIWLDTHRLTAGDIWCREIEDAIDCASVVVALSVFLRLRYLPRRTAAGVGKRQMRHPRPLANRLRYPSLSPDPPVARLQQLQTLS
jgi:hypothetical protein